MPALAQDASESDAPSASSTDGPAEADERFADARTAFAEALAEELELPVDRVDDALTAVRERLVDEWRDQRRAALAERLDDAVADDELTQEQADAILDAAEAGVLGEGRGHGFHGFGHHGFGAHGPGGWFGGDGGDAAEDTSAADRA